LVHHSLSLAYRSEMATPKQTDPQFKLRLTADLKDEIERAAAANNRSMNAEIIARLEAIDFVRIDLEQTKRERDQFAQSKKLSDEKYKAVQKQLEVLRSFGAGQDRRILYVAIDADGLPISWPEVSRHLEEIIRASGKDIKQIDSRVFDPDIVSSDSREEEWGRLIRHYRALRESEG